jgi:hypothetical protein
LFRGAALHVLSSYLLKPEFILFIETADAAVRAPARFASDPSQIWFFWRYLGEPVHSLEPSRTGSLIEGEGFLAEFAGDDPSERHRSFLEEGADSRTVSSAG